MFGSFWFYQGRGYLQFRNSMCLSVALGDEETCLLKLRVCRNMNMYMLCVRHSVTSDLHACGKRGWLGRRYVVFATLHPKHKISKLRQLANSSPSNTLYLGSAIGTPLGPNNFGLQGCSRRKGSKQKVTVVGGPGGLLSPGHDEHRANPGKGTTSS